MTPTDFNGKVIRVGDRVHRITARRIVRKKSPNGRVLGPLQSRTIRQIHITRTELPTDDPEKPIVLEEASVQLRGKRTYCHPSWLIKQ